MKFQESGVNLVLNAIDAIFAMGAGRAPRKLKAWQRARIERSRELAAWNAEFNAKREPSRQERRRKEIKLARRYGHQKGVTWQEARRMLRAQAAKRAAAMKAAAE